MYAVLYLYGLEIWYIRIYCEIVSKVLESNNNDTQ